MMPRSREGLCDKWHKDQLLDDTAGASLVRQDLPQGRNAEEEAWVVFKVTGVKCSGL